MATLLRGIDPVIGTALLIKNQRQSWFLSPGGICHNAVTKLLYR
jgi:hypothetical protein